MICPAPRVTRTGEIECPLCGRTGDPGTELTCHLSGLPSDRVARTRIIAARELVKIRTILSSARPPTAVGRPVEPIVYLSDVTLSPGYGKEDRKDKQG